MINSYIALGYKCNHNCLNCPLSTYDRLHGELDSEVIKKNIAKLSSYSDSLHITISGGEPTLNPNFLEVLKILGKANAYITILSNATKCKDKNFVDSIIESLGNDYDFKRFRYITAIHSLNKNIHDRLTGVDGSYIETMKGLENLDERNIQVTIKNIMNKVTALDMKKTLEYLCNYFSNNIDFELCATDYSGRCRKNIDELYINFADLQPYVEDSLDSYERNKNNCGRKLEIIETPLCLVDPYYWKYYKINNNRSLTYIAPNDDSMDNMSENTTSNCNTNYNECQQCDVKEFCSGIWQSTYNLEPDKEKIIRRIRSL